MSNHGVAIIPTNKIFWNSFLYKIHAYVPNWIPERQQGIIIGKMTLYCPSDNTDWKLQTLANGAYFYFKDKQSMEYFVDNNDPYISAIYVPFREDDIKNLQKTEDGHFPTLRKTLWFGIFKYKITFKNIPQNRETALDEWAEEFFESSNSKRHLYVYNKRRVLYLNDDTDVFMSTMAHKDIISRIEIALLK